MSVQIDTPVLAHGEFTVGHQVFYHFPLYYHEEGSFLNMKRAFLLGYLTSEFSASVSTPEYRSCQDMYLCLVFKWVLRIQT